MATTTPLQSLPIPDPADAANVPYWLAQLAQTLESRLAMRFTSAAARDAAIPAPVAGMVAYIGSGRFTAYNGSRWVDYVTAALPAQARASSAGGSFTGTVGSWVNLSTGGNIAVSMTLPAPALVCIEFGARVQVGFSAGSGEIKIGPRITGATTEDPDGQTLGEVPTVIASSGGGTQYFLVNGSRHVECNAGANTFTLQAQRAGTGTFNANGVNYPTLRVSAVRFT